MAARKEGRKIGESVEFVTQLCTELRLSEDPPLVAHAIHRELVETNVKLSIGACPTR